MCKGHTNLVFVMCVFAWERESALLPFDYQKKLYLMFILHLLLFLYSEEPPQHEQTESVQFKPLAGYTVGPD